MPPSGERPLHASLKGTVPREARRSNFLLENRRMALAALAMIVSGGVALRTYGLYGRSMWFDESMSWRTIQFSFPEMISRVARNVHVPLYYILLKSWVAVLGESLYSLRSVSLVCAAFAMVGLYLWACEAFRPPADRDAPNVKAKARWIGLATAALYAVSLYQIRLAWEIRMYTLGTALVAFSSWLLFRALFAPRQNWRLWVLYGLVTLLFAYTHLFALFSIAGQGVFVAGFALAHSRWRLKAALKSAYFRFATLAFGIIATGWALWLPVFLRQRQQVADGWWARPFAFSDVPSICYEMIFNKDVFRATRTWEAAVALLCAFVMISILRRAMAAEWYAFCMVAVPLALAVAESTAATNIFTARYFAFVQPFLLASLAALLWKIPGSAFKTVVAYGVVMAGLELHLEFVDSLDISERPGAHAAAANIDANRKSGEPVIACSTLLYFPMLFHAQDRRGWHVYSDREIPHYLGGPVMVSGQVINRNQMDAIAAKRAWVITSSSRWARQPMYIPSSWQKEDEQRFPEVFTFQTDVIVVTYTIPAGGRPPNAGYR